MSLSNVSRILTIVAAAVVVVGALEGYQYTSPEESGQYFTQDAHGQYSYGYKGPHGRKQEVRTIDGITRGTYSYIDGNRVWQTVQYIADSNGIRFEASNLPRDDSVGPEPVSETIEVAAERARHLAFHEKLKSGASSESVLPNPVKDTEEVALAKVEFFKRYQEELQRHKLIREQRRALNPIIPEFTYKPFQ